MHEVLKFIYAANDRSACPFFVFNSALIELRVAAERNANGAYFIDSSPKTDSALANAVVERLWPVLSAELERTARNGAYVSHLAIDVRGIELYMAICVHRVALTPVEHASFDHCASSVVQVICFELRCLLRQQRTSLRL